MQTSPCLLLPVALAFAASVSLAEETAGTADTTDAAGGRAPMHTVVPVYPERARRARVEGEVEVCFEVDREGNTRRVTVRRSTNRVFEKPARKAVRDSRYKPLPPGEKPSGIKTCRTFRFFLTPVAIETADD